MPGMIISKYGIQATKAKRFDLLMWVMIIWEERR